mgnify:CR=1 FL=1
MCFDSCLLTYVTSLGARGAPRAPRRARLDTPFPQELLRNFEIGALFGATSHFERHMGRVRLDCEVSGDFGTWIVTFRRGNVPSVNPFGDFVPFHGSSHLTDLIVSSLHNSDRTNAWKRVVDSLPEIKCEKTRMSHGIFVTKTSLLR